jgi:antitoxin PrlF
MESALTVKGQATIPKAVRDHLRLAPGDRIRFFIHPDGSVAILPKIPTSALRGIVRRRNRRVVSIAAMEEATAAGAAAKVSRKARR